MIKITRLALLTVFIAGCVPVEENAHSGNISKPQEQKQSATSFEFYQGAWDDSVKTAADIKTSTEASALADQALAQKDKNKAAAYYARAIELDPKNVNAGYQLAMLHEGSGNYGQAEQLYRYLLKQSPRHSGILERLGLILFEQGSNKEARRMLVKAVALFESHKVKGSLLQNYSPVGALNGLGLLSDREGKYQQAQAYYQQGLSLDSEQLDIMNNLAHSHLLAGNWRRAESLLYEVLRLQPQYTRAIYNLALANAQARRFDKSVELLERFMTPYEASNDAGYLAMIAGDHVAAEALFQQAIDLAPSYHEAAWRNMDKLKQLSTKGVRK